MSTLYILTHLSALWVDYEIYTLTASASLPPQHLPLACEGGLLLPLRVHHQPELRPQVGRVRLDREPPLECLAGLVE